MNLRTYPVVGVIGGSGGVGASSLAAVLAVAAATVGPSLLLDLDVAGGGIDVLLGREAVPGARWSGLHIDGGFLDPHSLLDGLPRAGPCAVLAADVAEIAASDAEQVLDAAAGVVPVVVDLPRGDSPARRDVVQRCALVVLLARADVSGLVAARAMASRLSAPALGLVLRHGDVPSAEAAGLVGVGLLGELPALGAARPVIDVERPPRPHLRLAEGVMAGMAGMAGMASVAGVATSGRDRTLVLAGGRR